MPNIIFKLLKKLSSQNSCPHRNVPQYLSEAYCPDCGRLIKNVWYVARCSSCNIKRKAHFERGQIKADLRFCANCGCEDLIIEKLEKINFIDLPYAIHVKIALEEEKNTSEISQIWVENEKTFYPKLLYMLKIN